MEQFADGRDCTSGWMYQAFEKYGEIVMIIAVALNGYCWGQLMLGGKEQ